MTPVLSFWLIRPFKYHGINHFIVAIIISILGKGLFSDLKKMIIWSWITLIFQILIADTWIVLNLLRTQKNGFSSHLVAYFSLQ